MQDQFRPFGRWISAYFRTYGGWTAVAQSPLFQISLVITGLNYSRWIKEGWVDLTQTLIPTLLGFSLGTYAILFSLLGNRLKGAMSSVSNDRGVSQLAAVNSTFFHFIFVQVLALIWAFLFSGTAVKDLFEQLPKSWIGAHNLYNALYLAGSAIGYLLLVYSVLLVLAAAMAIYRLAMIKDPADTSSS